MFREGLEVIDDGKHSFIDCPEMAKSLNSLMSVIKDKFMYEISISEIICGIEK